MATLKNIQDKINGLISDIKIKTNDQNITTLTSGVEKLKAGYNTGGINPSGTININANGNYDVTNFANAAVSVPSTGINPSGKITLTSNTPSVDVGQYKYAEVAVPASTFIDEEDEIIFGIDSLGKRLSTKPFGSSAKYVGYVVLPEVSDLVSETKKQSVVSNGTTTINMKKEDGTYYEDIELNVNVPSSAPNITVSGKKSVTINSNENQKIISTKKDGVANAYYSEIEVILNSLTPEIANGLPYNYGELLIDFNSSDLEITHGLNELNILLIFVDNGYNDELIFSFFSFGEDNQKILIYNNNWVEDATYRYSFDLNGRTLLIYGIINDIISSYPYSNFKYIAIGAPSNN